MDEGKRIRITFLSMNMERGGDYGCYFDHLEVNETQVICVHHICSF